MDCNDIWTRIRTHLKRTITWRILEVAPMEHEIAKMEGNETRSPVHNDTLQKYLVWRKSVLFTSILPVLFSAIMGLAEFRGDAFKDPFNGLGRLLNFLVLFDSCFLLAGVVVALIFWHLPQRTMRLLVTLWAVSVIVPLIPALFPVEYIITKESRDNTDEATLVALKIYLALAYAIKLLPVVITFPAGAWRGALRIRGLFPSSSLAGWVLLLCAPFYSIFVLVALVVIMQVTGNALLLVGAALLTLSPWIAVSRRHLYIADPTDKSERQLDLTQRVICVNNIIAFALLLIWALAEDVIGDGDLSLVGYGEGFRLVFEMIGRVLVTTLVFGDRLLQMAIVDWRIGKTRRDGNRGHEVDLMFGAIEESFPNSILAAAATKAGTEESSTQEDGYDDVENGSGGRNNSAAPTVENLEERAGKPPAKKKKYSSVNKGDGPVLSA